MGTARIFSGVSPGTIPVSFGYGHKEYGSKSYSIGDDVVKGNPGIGKGVLMDLVAIRDHTLGRPVLLGDPVCGAISRNYTPAKVEKV